MKYNPDIHQRRSIRLKDYDYSSAGAYFVTICTHDKECWLGDVVNSEMLLSEIGQIAEALWLEIPQHFENVILDDFIIMPNHLHGIVLNTDSRGVQLNASTKTNYYSTISPKKNTLSVVIHNNRMGLINQTPTTNKRIIQPIAPEQDDRWTLMKNPNQTLGKIIRFFKAKSSKLIHDSGFHDFRWQRNYYERVVRNQKELNRIWQYIANNPLQWESDNENPKNRETKP